MNQKTKENVYGFLFTLSIVMSLFNGIHEEWILKIVHTFLSNRTLAAIYPLFLLSLLIFIDKIISGQIKKYKPLLIFLIIYVVVGFVVNLHGILTFKYAKYLKIDELTGISKYCFNLLKKIIPTIPDYTNWAVVLMIRTTFNNIVIFYSQWFIIYSIALYCSEDKELYRHISLGLYISIGIVCFHEIFEIAYFMGKDWGKKYLETVMPYLIPTGGSWGALGSGIRNVFHEQAWYAYWACVVIPFFMYGYLEKKRWYDLVIAFFLMGCMFAGDSRTGVALVFIELVVLFGGFILIKRREAVKPLLTIGIILLIAIAIGIVFLSNRSVYTLYGDGSFFDRIIAFMDNTMGTLFDKNRRSNPSRFGMREAEFKTWLSSPILGVGAELKAFYIIDNYPEYGGSPSWFVEQKKVGSAPYQLPALNQFTSSLASGGILGFMVDTLPIICLTLWILILCFKRQVLSKSEDSVTHPYLYVMTSMIVMLAFGFSNTIFINGLAFMIPGLALSYIERTRDRKEI